MLLLPLTDNDGAVSGNREEVQGRARREHQHLQTKPATAMTTFVCWLLNVPATCECISGTDLRRQFYALPH